MESLDILLEIVPEHISSLRSSQTVGQSRDRNTVGTPHNHNIVNQPEHSSALVRASTMCQGERVKASDVAAGKFLILEEKLVII